VRPNVWLGCGPLQEAISRSPVYSHLSSSLEGLAVLRAFGLEERFLRQFYKYQDTNTRIYVMFIYISRWCEAARG